MFETRCVRFMRPGVMFLIRSVRFLTPGMMFLIHARCFYTRYDVFDSCEVFLPQV